MRPFQTIPEEWLISTWISTVGKGKYLASYDNPSSADLARAQKKNGTEVIIIDAIDRNTWGNLIYRTETVEFGDSQVFTYNKTFQWKLYWDGRPWTNDPGEEQSDRELFYNVLYSIDWKWLIAYWLKQKKLNQPFMILSIDSLKGTNWYRPFVEHTPNFGDDFVMVQFANELKMREELWENDQIFDLNPMFFLNATVYNNFIPITPLITGL